jgi:hypothetical protein
MPVHGEGMCRFKLKVMQEGQQKPKAPSYEAFAVEQAEISEFLDASGNIKEMPKMKEFLDNMETGVCSHDLTLLILQV